MFGQFSCLCNWDVETGLLVSEEDMCDEHKVRYEEYVRRVDARHQVDLLAWWLAARPDKPINLRDLPDGQDPPVRVFYDPNL